MTGRADRLAILQERLPGQDCASCPNREQCWERTDDGEAIAINLLICRMQRGIRRNASARDLLRRLEPKLLRYLRGFPDKREALADLQSAIIESLLLRYRMGARVPPLYWLFQKRGAAEQWQRKQRRQQATRGRLVYAGALDTTDLIRLNELVTHGRVTSGPQALAVPPYEYDDYASERERVQQFMTVLEDGCTLTAREYRVLAFCVRFTREAGARARNGSQRLYGVHTHLGRVLGLNALRVGDIYERALRKVIDAMGASALDAYLKQYGIRAPQRPRGAPLTSDDRHAIQQAREQRVPIPYLALVYGVSVRQIRNASRPHAATRGADNVTSAADAGLA